MELRLGPGGNRDEVIGRLRESLVEVITTERQLRIEIERLSAERQRLGPPTDPSPVVAPPADTAAAPTSDTSRIPGEIPSDAAPVPTPPTTESPELAEDPAIPDSPAGRLDARLADLRTQLSLVEQARDEIATQLQHLPSLAAQSEGQANVAAVYRLLAAAGFEDIDSKSLEPLRELSTLSVDEELAALRREMGLEPPPAAKDTPSP